MVTGGAGFLGSHLCDRLLEQGHRVICVDDFSTGRIGNIEHLQNCPRFKLVRHDVRRPLQSVVDQIYNLASPASPPAYQADPIRTTTTSVLGALNVLELAQRHNAKVLQASTSEVYGDPDVHPQREDYCGHVNPIGIRACYDEGKRCAESLFFDYARKRGVRIKVARIFNTYGPRMRLDDGRVVSNFIVQALSGKDLTVYGDGQQTRSFCFVDDMVDGLIRLMETPDDVQGPLNLGNPFECTVGGLAGMVIEMVASGTTLVHRPLPADDPRQRRPDISRASAVLGWQPRIALREGLQRTISYFAGSMRAAETMVAAE